MAEADEREEASASPEARAERDAPRRRAPVRDEAEPETEAKAPLPKPNYAFLAGWSFVFMASDLITKWWATGALEGREDPIVVIPGLLRFELAHNRGGAWSMFADQPDSLRLPFFFAVSAAATVFIISLFRKLEPHQKALKWALPFVLGGAFGNLVDRIRLSHVVDFIDPYHYWPTFNVADIWIVVGVGLMAIDMFTPRPRAATASARATATEGDLDKAKGGHDKGDEAARGAES